MSDLSGLISPGVYKPSFNSGEIAPEAAGRTEIKSYFSGAKRMIRAAPVPQGGFDLLPGTAEIALVRGILASAGNGTLTIAPGPYSLGAVIGEADAGSPVTFDAIDLSGLVADQTCGVQLQYRLTPVDGWTALAPFTVDAATRAYRAGLKPGSPAVARYFRLVAVAVTGSASIAVATTITFQRDVTPASDARAFAFTIDRQRAYEIIATAGNLDIYRNRAFLAAVATPYSEAQIVDLRARQRDKTMLLFHPDVPDKKLLWQSDADWLFGDQIYKNVPAVDLGGLYTKIADKWRLTVVHSATTQPQIDQSLLTITVGGETTEGIALTNANGSNAQRDAIAADIKTKIEALADIEPGVTVTADPYTITNNFAFTIEFTGADNIGGEFQVSGRVTAAVAVAVNAERLVRGDPGGEPLISATRGYARHAAFWQQRTVLAGFRSKVTSFLASVQADYFNLNTKIVTTDGAILVNLDTEASDQIEWVVAAGHLLFFSKEAEYFVADRVLSRTQPVNVVRTGANGCAQNVPVVEADDALFFVNRDNSIVLSLEYSDVKQRYEATPVSLLATHITNGIVDAAFQRPEFGADAGRYFLVRADGEMTVGSIVRSQEVTGFVRWPTDGAVRRVMVNGANIAHVIASRRIAGVDRLVFEVMDDALFLDQALRFTYSAPQTVIGGLSTLEGANVWALADGYVDGPFTVAAATITLPVAASSVIVGRWTAPIIETLPPNREIAPNTVLRRPGKVKAIDLTVMETTSIALGANGGAPKNVPLARFGDPVDQPLPEQNRALRVAHFSGYAKEPTAVITQIRPGKLKVRDVTLEMGL